MLPQLVDRVIFSFFIAFKWRIKGHIAHIDVVHSVNAFTMSATVHAAVHAFMHTLLLTVVTDEEILQMEGIL